MAALGWTDDDLVDFTAAALALACEDDNIAPLSDEDEAEADALAKALGLAADEDTPQVILGRCA